MRDIFDLIKKEFLTYENIEKHFEEINRNGDIFSNFMQCDLGDDIMPLVNKTSSFAITEDNKYIAKFTFPSFITPDMIDIDVIDVGIPLLAMHAPYEVAGKFDTYMAYKGYKAFYDSL